MFWWLFFTQKSKFHHQNHNSPRYRKHPQFPRRCLKRKRDGAIKVLGRRVWGSALGLWRQYPFWAQQLGPNPEQGLGNHQPGFPRACDLGGLVFKVQPLSLPSPYPHSHPHTQQLVLLQDGEQPTLSRVKLYLLNAQCA